MDDQHTGSSDDDVWRRPAAEGESTTRPPVVWVTGDDAAPGSPPAPPAPPTPPARAGDDDEFWGPATAASPVRAPGPAGPADQGSRRKWAAAGIGAVVIAVAAIVAIKVGGSSSQTLGTGGAATGRGPGGVFAGPGGRRGGFGGGGAGTISAINGSTITVKTVAGQTLTVHTTGSTAVTTTATATVGDVKAGDNVLVRGTGSGTSVAADDITDGRATSVAGPFGAFRGAPPAGAAGQGRAGNGGFGGGFFGGRGVAGVVKSVDGGTLTVAAQDGSTVTVTTSSSTAVTVVNPSSVGALHVGDQIRVTPASGSNPSSGTITAAAIRAGSVGR
jgi:hypothetical protein